MINIKLAKSFWPAGQTLLCCYSKSPRGLDVMDSERLIRGLL